jgi:hypothetical protein
VQTATRTAGTGGKLLGVDDHAASQAAPEDFLSGDSGTVRHPRLAGLADAGFDLALRVRGVPGRLAREAAAEPRRRVLVAAVERPELPGLLDAARAELAASRHEVAVHTVAAEQRGKFQNLNALLAEHPPEGCDWLLVLDDDVALPRGFLDVFLLLAERHRLRLAQPAHRRASHAAWAVTRRRAGALTRRTRFVEIGPVTAFHSDTFATLLPFPDLRFGWGLDLHWGAVAEGHGWPVGVIDAVPVGHALRPAATTYPREAAVEEARAFLAARPYLSAARAQETLEVWR